MANEEQLSILKQGVDVWNRWREMNSDIKIDLSEANLSSVDLVGANFHEANFARANFFLSSLIRCIFENANLERVNFEGATLNDANLRKSDLHGANLTGANLMGANLQRTELRYTNLRSTNLVGTDFAGANLIGADLSDANIIDSYFWGATIGATIFGNVNLSRVIGLQNMKDFLPSSISTNTFALSKGKIPDIFLRGCGLSDWEIEETKLYDPDLSNEEIDQILYRIHDLRASQSLQISPLFISYSHTDGAFVDKIEGQLNKKGIRFWRDTHEMKSGRIETQIDRAISQNRTVLLVLSQNSIKSDWVEHEVRTARELEKGIGRDVLCPIALDDSWKSRPWPKRVMEQIMEYNILDFSAWEDDSQFEGMFRRLIDGLELFYKDKSNG